MREQGTIKHTYQDSLSMPQAGGRLEMIAGAEYATKVATQSHPLDGDPNLQRPDNIFFT